MSDHPLPIKKSVVLPWRGQQLRLEVAQELFSSHQVDKGSRMLLDSLDPDAFGAGGMGADFGCGYGVLGIAWQGVKPGWSMHYVDRDALAVAFSAYNADQHKITTAEFTTAISLSAPEAGYDLVLWNVPGKAGRSVVAGLLDVTIDTLAPGGMLAAVVVHPLADVFTDGLNRTDVRAAYVERGTEHTVVHLHRLGGGIVRRDPFVEGLFDREARMFNAADLSWSLTPVIGLPEYDELGHATQLAATMLAELPSEDTVQRWLVVEPGVGHLPVVASQLWPEAKGTIAGRDALALRSAARAVGDPAPGIEPIWGLGAASQERDFDVAVVAVPVQASADEIATGLDAIRRCVASSGKVVLHGRSTEIARAERALRRQPGWRAGRPVKHRGFAALAVRTLLP